MPIEIQTALISGLIAILIASLGGFFTWRQMQGERERIQQERKRIQQERTQWLIDLKSSYSVELYKTRLSTYPTMGEVIGRLSKHTPKPLTPETARQIAYEIHEWLYSPGGLCAESSTRGALKELRTACLSWKQGDKPSSIADWRHIALFLLRRDLDIQGIESFDPIDRGPLLDKMKEIDKSLKQEL